jgi:hypothetical protein
MVTELVRSAAPSPGRAQLSETKAGRNPAGGGWVGADGGGVLRPTNRDGGAGIHAGAGFSERARVGPVDADSPEFADVASPSFTLLLKSSIRNTPPGGARAG